jgi:16S rRNA processing protein RimM
MNTPAPKYLLLGEILRPHGVRGEVRLRILTDHPERIATLEQVFLGRNTDDAKVTAYGVEHMRMQNEYGLLKLKGVNNRDDADTLRGLYAMVDLENAVPLEEGEFYLYQLIGLFVKTDDGQELGTITDVLETGANDVYIVNSPVYGEVLIPVTDETILETDIAAGIVRVKLPDGLLPSEPPLPKS